MVTYFFVDNIIGEVRGTMPPNILQSYPVVKASEIRSSNSNNFPPVFDNKNGNDGGMIKSRSDEKYQNYNKDDPSHFHDMNNYQGGARYTNGARTPSGITNGHHYPHNNNPMSQHHPPVPHRSFQNFNITENPHMSNPTTPLLQQEMYSNSTALHEMQKNDNYNHNSQHHPHYNNQASQITAMMHQQQQRNSSNIRQPQMNGCHEDEPLLHNNPAAIMSNMNNIRQHNPPKYEPPRYAAVPPHVRQIYQQQHQQHQQQHPPQLQPADSQPKVHQPMLRVYMKPLPKLPADDSRDMSSTDDLSSRPHSPSMSSSDESYSKTTENEEGTDSPLPPPNQILRAQNPLQWLYPGDIQVDPTISPKLSPIELSNLKEFEISSTTESAAASTIPNKGESCNSFEYLNDRGYPKSPFEREIQRLLESSNRAAALQNANAKDPLSGHVLALPNSSGVQITNGNKTSGSSNSAGSSNNGQSSRENLDTSSSNGDKPKITNQSILMCGLEAIREITRNKNPSESSQMQTSDTESCEIINDLRMSAKNSEHSDLKSSPNAATNDFFARQESNCIGIGLGKSFLVRKESLKSTEGGADTDDNELIEDEIHQNYISDALKYGAGHQSVDSNPIESQSEWSDDEIREEATGESMFFTFCGQVGSNLQKYFLSLTINVL